MICLQLLKVISIPNISKQQPYDLETTIQSSEVSSDSDKGTSDSASRRKKELVI